MKKLLYTLLLSALLPLGLVAQSDSILYGLNFTGAALNFANADITSGQVSVLGLSSTIPGQFASGISDLDASGGKYFYIQADRVVTVDIQTGTVLYSPQITCTSHAVSSFMPVVNIAWNPLDGKLYCLHFYDSELRFATLNPVTGVLTIMTTNPISGALFGSGVSDLDPIGRRYFYVRNGHLLTVNLNNGNVISNVMIDNSSNADMPITNIAYNWVTNQVFGLNFKGEVLDSWGNPITPPEVRLATVDPMTGKVNLISRNSISSSQFESGVSDIHFAGNFYTFVQGGAINRQVISVDLSTGDVLWQPALSNPNSALSPLTNISYAKDFTAISYVPRVDFDYDSVGLGAYSFRDLSAYAKNVLWNFGDGQTSTVRYPGHVYSAPGQYAVTLIASNTTGSDTIVKYITVGSLVAVAPQMELDWTLYPNPASDVLRVRAAGTASMEDILLQLVNVQGQVIREKNIQAYQAGNDMVLEIPSGVANGVYFLRMSSAAETRNFRFMVSR